MFGIGKAGEVFEFSLDFNSSFEGENMKKIEEMWRRLLINMKILFTA